MTTPTEAMRLAREALAGMLAEVLRDSTPARKAGRLALEAIDALPAPSGEPVAWFCEWFNANGSPEWDQYHDRTDPMPSDDEWEDRPPDRVTPLYTAPQAAPAPLPLTDEQIEDLIPYTNRGHNGLPAWGRADLHWFARAIERAHGITASQAKG